MASTLTLTANPGSASRKYALFEGDKKRASLHLEWLEQKVICTLESDGSQKTIDVSITDLEHVAGHIPLLLQTHHLLKDDESIQQIGLRIVAPGAYFLEHRPIDETFVTYLKTAQKYAPLHISATLAELDQLHQHFQNVAITGISDSAFHKSKPDRAWNYGLPLSDADRFDIKRFGYHGLSIASVVRALNQANKLPSKLIVCHIGSGVSITAVQNGKSFDTTMGYSPLEGPVMATRSGSIDFAAARTLKRVLDFDDEQLETYLNQQAGLLGLGGSADLRKLLQRESNHDHQAHLAVETYLFSLQKAIGQMTGALGGLDALVFTGTIGERSAIMRQRLGERLKYLGLALDEKVDIEIQKQTVIPIHRAGYSKPIYVISANEEEEMMLTFR